MQANKTFFAKTVIHGSSPRVAAVVQLEKTERAEQKASRHIQM